MRALLDTHTLLWWFDADPQLSPVARALIENDSAEVFVSAVSAWEIATKARLGKLPRAMPIALRLPEAIKEQGFIPLVVTIEHGHRAGWLAGSHRDPFDRILAAQSQAEALPLVTTDPVFATFGVATIW